MKKYIWFVFLIFCSCSLSAQQTKNNQYFEGEIIVKIKSKYNEKCNKSAISIPSIFDLVKQNQIYQTQKLFPNHKKVNEKNIRSGWIDLSTIYKFKHSQNIDPQKIINQLLKNEAVEYAELNVENRLTFSTSDTLKESQWYIDAIDAYEAWDVEKGDSSVVIAIVDTGSDLDHEDMIDDFAYNHNDPINGIDDDNDGYIDNFNGWDVANNDNNANLNLSGHGMNAAGIASASTDNVTGISGVGFNTRILTVRIDDENTGRLTAAYEGIVYAADYGAFIISNSWGSHTYSSFGQDVINYAAINKKALVIAAVGNDGREDRFYPSAYDNVLSVGSTIPDDTVKANSNFGYWVDIMAPGESMLTTGAKNSYHRNGGTSMAGPVVAGVAALVKSRFPNYSAQQVTEQILNSGDNINAINDPKYINKLGVGRVNAFKAVSQMNLPGIVFENINVSDQKQDFFIGGTELYISGEFINYLADAKNVRVSLKEMSNKLEILKGNTEIGNLNSSSNYLNSNEPFRFRIKNGLSLNDVLEMEVSIIADNYSKKQYFSINVNVDYLTVNKNDIRVTINSDGCIGYSGPTNNLGEGIAFKDGNSLLFDGGFIVGNSSNYLPNRFRKEGGGRDLDFITTSSIQIDAPLKADFETTAIFNDGNHENGGKLNVLQKTYHFEGPSGKQSVVYVYALQNKTETEIQNLHAGLLLDWDIGSYTKNKVIYDASRKMGVSYSTDTNLVAGVLALTNNIPNHHYAIDNNGNNSGINTADGFSDEEKFRAISENRNIAGDASTEGNDIIGVSSIGPFSLAAGETKTAAFAIILAASQSELNQEADAVVDLYEQNGLTDIEFPPAPILTNQIKLYPNPANEILNVEVSLEQAGQLELYVSDVNGKIVMEEKSLYYDQGVQLLKLNTLSLKTGVYFIRLKGGSIDFQNKFVVTPIE